MICLSISRMRFANCVLLSFFLTGLILSLPAHAEAFRAKVVGVSAGDIFEIEREGKVELVVLYGVNAPGAKSIAGKEAKRIAAERVLDKEVDVLVVERRAGMTLVEFKLKNKANLGHVMLRRGLLKWDRFTAPSDKGLQELEQLAKSQRRGLWLRPSLAPAAPPEDAVQNPAAERTLVDNPEAGLGYQLLEARVRTDSKGVKTLVLRGNGVKIVGFEGEVVRRRVEAHRAYLAELERQERAYFRQQEKLARRAAEEEELLRQEALQLEFEQMVYDNRRLIEISQRPLHVWSNRQGWIY